MAKKNNLEDQLKRVLADYQNLQRRVNEEKTEFIKFANSVLLTKLLAAVDDLEKASEHLKDAGLNLTVGKLKQVLAEEGVKPMVLLATVFDPKLAECAELAEGEKDKVVTIIRPGYTLNGQVLRPARVTVGKGPAVAKAMAGEGGK